MQGLFPVRAILRLILCARLLIEICIDSTDARIVVMACVGSQARNQKPFRASLSCERKGSFSKGVFCIEQENCVVVSGIKNVREWLILKFHCMAHCNLRAAKNKETKLLMK